MLGGGEQAPFDRSALNEQSFEQESPRCDLKGAAEEEWSEYGGEAIRL